MSTPQYFSPHFSFLEMTRTDNRKFLEKNRQVPEELLASGKALCETILEPIREHFGKPLIVHSGYRCPELNSAIGGSKASQHKLFEACDFHVSGVDMTETWEWIADNLAGEGRVGQAILEGWSAGQPGWIHISLGTPWRDIKKCGQIMTFHQVSGKYTTARIVK
jgi:zinc D-Ala-D-Ala carboxypeptidase